MAVCILALGNTAMAGMGAIDPQVFAQHGNALRIIGIDKNFDGVNGFQQLSPDRPFASVPYAMSAGTTKSETDDFLVSDGSVSSTKIDV